MTTDTQKSEISKHLRVLKEKLSRFLSDEKPSDILILKAHLICEYYLNQILILKSVCDAQNLNGLSFAEKNSKAFNASNVSEKKVHDSLRSLNKLRNKIGHELEYSLSESDVDEIGYVLGTDYVVEKYDFEKLEELLRNTLMTVVISVSLVVFDLVNEKKKSAQVQIIPPTGNGGRQDK